MDELDEPVHTRPRWLGELLGLLLLGLFVGTTGYLNRTWPGPNSIAKSVPTLVGGVDFLFMASLLLASYYLPGWSVVFKFFSWCAENLPGTMGGRSGLLLLGSLFAIVGFCAVVVGLGVFA